VLLGEALLQAVEQSLGLDDAVLELGLATDDHLGNRH
jgi:hypothetical protein